MPESSTPESSTPESSTPESSTPESSTPESSTPETSTKVNQRPSRANPDPPETNSRRFGGGSPWSSAEIPGRRRRRRHPNHDRFPNNRVSE
jgi:hypothetical protein